MPSTRAMSHHMPSRRMVCIAAVMACVTGCAAGGDPGDGGSNLPDRGFGGYERLLDAEGDPLQPIPRPDGVQLGDPMARVVDGRVELYVTACPDGEPCHIARAESDDGIAFGAPGVVARDPAGLSAPFVFEDTLYAIRAGDVVAIDVARPDAAPVTVLAADGAPFDSPSVVRIDRPWLYATRADGDAIALVRAPLDDPEAIETLTVPPLPDVWAPPAILQPEVRRATTGAGRTVYRMAYAGRIGGGDGDLAFAASFDGATWSNWPFDPSLGGDADEFAPSNVRLGDRYLLYFARRSGRLGLAERSADNPTERF